MKKDRTLTRIITTAAVIVVVVGFFFIGCQSVNVSILSITRTYGVDIDQQGTNHSSSIPVNPTVDKKSETKLGYNP